MYMYEFFLILRFDFDYMVYVNEYDRFLNVCI